MENAWATKWGFPSSCIMIPWTMDRILFKLGSGHIHRSSIYCTLRGSEERTKSAARQNLWCLNHIDSIAWDCKITLGKKRKVKTACFRMWYTHTKENTKQIGLASESMKCDRLSSWDGNHEQLDIICSTLWNGFTVCAWPRPKVSEVRGGTPRDGSENIITMKPTDVIKLVRWGLILCLNRVQQLSWKFPRNLPLIVPSWFQLSPPHFHTLSTTSHPPDLLRLLKITKIVLLCFVRVQKGAHERYRSYCVVVYSISCTHRAK